MIEHYLLLHNLKDKRINNPDKMNPRITADSKRLKERVRKNSITKSNKAEIMSAQKDWALIKELKKDLLNIFNLSPFFI